MQGGSISDNSHCKIYDHAPIIMSTIQGLKNFIRHGKQARLVTPHAEPTTDVSAVHAEDHRQRQGHHSRHHSGHHGHGHSHSPAAGKVNAIEEKHARGHAEQQKAPESQTKRNRDAEIQQIVAEERQSSSKMPRYPGLERWILLEKMGDGAFSNVYRARDSSGEFDQVAIKVVRKFEMNSNQRANILKEVQIMRQLDHPNIIKLLKFFEAPQYYYIILELCSGGELFHQIVRLTYFSEDLSRHVIVQVARAIEYLHETSGVVHRDIKPENLLFDPVPFIPSKRPKPCQPGDEDKEDEGEFIPGVGAGGIGQIKIADFGLSKIIWDNQTMTPCGTVGYTAPEIVKDERYSKSVDMWALGCVLYTILCGFPPFYDESIQVLTEKVARGEYTFLSPWWDDISSGAKDLVSHLLTVDPEKRYSIGEFLSHPWVQQAEETRPVPQQALESGRENEKPLDPLTVDQAPYRPFSQRVVDEPSASSQRPVDFRSPGAINLREIFDVGYAVHRQEEEGKRRKNFKQGYRGTGFSSALYPLNEDYDDDEEAAQPSYAADTDYPPSKIPKSSQQAGDVAGMEAKLRSTSLGAQNGNDKQSRYQQQSYGQHNPNVASAAKESIARRSRQPFELSLDNATMLERRGRRHQQSQQVA